MTGAPHDQRVPREDDDPELAEIDALARGSSADLVELVRRLSHKSWAVRRVVIARAAQAGPRALEPLVQALVDDRSDETRIAAAVDALSALECDFEPTLGALTEHADPAIVCDALQIIGRRRTRALLPRVAALAHHEDDNVAIAAIEALGRIGGVETLEPLVAAVESKSFFRVFPALDALGRTGDARAVAPLIALLDEPNSRSGAPGPYAMEVLRALGHTGQRAAIVPLLQQLHRTSDAFVRTAAVALADLREHHEARFGEADLLRRSNADQLPFGSDRVIDCLESTSPVERASLVRTLAWLGDEAALSHLIVLASTEGPARDRAIDALRRLGRDACDALITAIRGGQARVTLIPLVVCQHAAPALVACLADPDPNVRALACEALARVGATSAVAPLFDLLRDREPRVSQAAAAALQSLGSIETRRLALAEARSADPAARRAALRIVAYFGYPEGLDVLIEATNDEDERVRESAVVGLALIDDPRATATLLATLSTGSARIRGVSARSLAQVGSTPEVLAALANALSDEDAWVRYYACQAIGKQRAVSEVGRLVERLDDEAGQVRIAAVEALARVASVDARAGQALVTASRSSDDDLRRAALVGLGIARRPEGVPILKEAALAQEPATRLVAISALAEFDLPETISVLRYAASDAEDSVRSAAIGFLSTRPGPAATAALVELLLLPATRARALNALSVAAEERIEGLLEALHAANAERAPLFVMALTRMRRGSAQAAMADALRSENVEARRAAAAGLASLGTKESREALARALSDTDPEVRRICVSAVQSPATDAASTPPLDGPDRSSSR